MADRSVDPWHHVVVPWAGARFFRRLWESPLFDAERERSKRGVRGPLDWYSDARFYVSVPLGLLIGIGLGLQLLIVGPGWLHLLGPLVFVPSVWLAWQLLRWLRRPVDAEALAAMLAERRARGLRKRRPPRFPPGSRNATRLPSGDEEGNKP